MSPERRKFSRRKALIGTGAVALAAGGLALNKALDDSRGYYRQIAYDVFVRESPVPTTAPDKITRKVQATPGLIVPDQEISPHPDLPEGPRRQDTESAVSIDYSEIKKELRKILGKDDFRNGIARFEKETIDIRFLKEAINKKDDIWVVYGIGVLAEFARGEAKVDESGFVVLPAA